MFQWRYQSFNWWWMFDQFRSCLTWEPSHLVSPHSSWDSNQALYHHHHLCGRRSPLCCSWSLWLAAGSTRKKMDLLRSSRSCCPSRLSRPHLWSWQSRMCRCWYYHKPKQQSGWTPASISSHSPLLWFRSCPCCEGSRQGGLVRQPHLQFSRWTQNYFSTLTFTATAFCRAKWGVHWLPESGSSGRVGSTSHVNVTLAAAAFGNKWRLLSATNATIVIAAVLGSSRCDTKEVRCWRHWRTFWKRLKVKSPIGISDKTALTQLQIVLWWLLS